MAAARRQAASGGQDGTNSRADAIRWALARVRERPACRKLVDRVRKIWALCVAKHRLDED